MKNDKTMKAKTKAPTPKTAAAAPAVKAPEATPVRQPSAKVMAPAAPVKAQPAPPAAKAPEAAPVPQPSTKAIVAEAPAAAVPSQPKPAAAPVVAAQTQVRPVVAPPAEPPACGRREITSDLIALRAYNLWEQQGRPQGREMANWLLAESQLKQEIQSFTA